ARVLALASPEERPRLLRKAAWAATLLGRYAEARAQLDEAVRGLRATGDNVELGAALSYLGYVANVTGDAATARAAVAESVAVVEREPPDATVALVYARRAGEL